jgi:hypothetical protein
LSDSAVKTTKRTQAEKDAGNEAVSKLCARLFESLNHDTYCVKGKGEGFPLQA